MEDFSENETENLLGDIGALDTVEDNELFEDDDEEPGDHSEAEEVPAPGSSQAGQEKKPRSAKQKKVVKNPQPKLNFDSLKGPKGLTELNKQFADFKFKGTGFEKEDLSQVMRLLEQWSFRLFPKFHFEDSLQRLESLGKKKLVQCYLTKVRLGIEDSEEVVRQFDDDGEPEAEDEAGRGASPDPFDQLLSQQIAASQSQQPAGLTAEQQERLQRNRAAAQERRQAARAAQQVSMETDESEVVT